MDARYIYITTYRDSGEAMRGARDFRWYFPTEIMRSQVGTPESLTKITGLIYKKQLSFKGFGSRQCIATSAEVTPKVV